MVKVFLRTHQDASWAGLSASINANSASLTRCGPQKSVQALTLRHRRSQFSQSWRPWAMLSGAVGIIDLRGKAAPRLKVRDEEHVAQRRLVGTTLPHFAGRPRGRKAKSSNHARGPGQGRYAWCGVYRLRSRRD